MRGGDTELGPKDHFKHVRIMSSGQSCQHATLMLAQSPTFFSSLGSAAANNRVKTTCGAILQAGTGSNEHAAQDRFGEDGDPMAKTVGCSACSNWSGDAARGMPSSRS